jgi:hypothetical protein
MHCFRARSAIRRLRIAAVVIVMTFLIAIFSTSLLVYAFAVHDDEMLLQSLYLILLTSAMLVLRWLLSIRTNCPLCMAPVMAKNHCATHRHSKRTLGSHRMRVALSILLTNRFTCPYCHERSELRLKSEAE